MKSSLLLSAALLLAGCQSYDVVQRNVFSDEDGNLVVVDYGRSESDHTNTFLAPTGKEMEFKSRLAVKVHLPDDDTFTAWQCMNVLRSGTLYKTDSEKYVAHVNGFTCCIYRQSDQDPTQYVPIYRGVLCESPKLDVEKDERWKVIQKKVQ